MALVIYLHTWRYANSVKVDSHISMTGSRTSSKYIIGSWGITFLHFASLCLLFPVPWTMQCIQLVAITSGPNRGNGNDVIGPTEIFNKSVLRIAQSQIHQFEFFGSGQPQRIHYPTHSSEIPRKPRPDDVRKQAD